MDGGALDLPDGRIIREPVSGSGNEFLLKHRYVMFLISLTTLDAFGCRKAWLLDGGHAVAVSADDLARVANRTSTYNGIDEATFFAALAKVNASWDPQNPH